MTEATNQGATSDKYRAELYDEVWNKARDMGYGNVTEALVALDRIKSAPPAAAVVPEWLLSEELFFDRMYAVNRAGLERQRLELLARLNPAAAAVPHGPYAKGDTDPVGDCDKFEAGIHVDEWFQRIVVYGDSPEDAEQLRDVVLAGLASLNPTPVEQNPAACQHCAATTGEACNLNGCFGLENVAPDHLRDAAAAASTPEPVSRDWPGGNYYCKCSVCGQQFSGHKRQLVCRLCSEQPAKEKGHE